MFQVDTDCILGVKESDVELDLFRHPTIIGALKSEIPPHLRIKDFLAIAPKVYSLNFATPHSSHTCKSVTKMKGFSIRGQASQKIVNSDTMYNFVRGLQTNQHRQTNVPQFQMKIDGVSKKICGKMQDKKLQTHAVAKRFVKPEVSPTKTFAYGLTSWHQVNGDLCDRLYYRNLDCLGITTLE